MERLVRFLEFGVASFESRSECLMLNRYLVWRVYLATVLRSGPGATMLDQIVEPEFPRIKETAAHL